jgi:TolB protein
MRKALLASVVLTLLALLCVSCDNGTRAVVPTVNANTFTFIRELAGGGSAASAHRQLQAWTVRSHGQKALKMHRGTGLAPWDITVDPGTDSVVLMQNDGTNERVIANQAGVFWSAQLASKAKKGVFVAEVSGYQQVFVVGLTDLNNLVITPLTTDSENHGYPQLSKDGTQVVFMKYVDVGESSIVQTVVMSASGGTETVISTPKMWTYAPAFTPDGKIIFTNDYTGQIHMMNVDGSGMETITASEGTCWDYFPSVSLDGLTVTFSRYDEYGSAGDNIYTQKLDGTNLQKLTTDGKSWDPLYVNNKIVFVSWRDEANGDEIYSMSLDGTAQTRLTTNDANEYFWYD